MKKFHQHGQFSRDPNENLRIENELLKLKMQAEYEATFGVSPDLPPEIEHAFLQNVLEFEKSWQEARKVKVYDLLGRPAFRPAATLSQSEIRKELKRIIDVMSEKNIVFDTIENYDPLLIYRFITEELFNHETEDLNLPGWTKNFIYEEFHTGQ